MFKAENSEGDTGQGTGSKSLPKLLKPADLPDNFTRSLYKIAPYKGCAHGCRYCDGRAERYYIEGDFEKDIEVRHSIPERLDRDLNNIRERGIISFGSGVTDSYQPLEALEHITSKCAALLAASPRPVPALVMTKSSLTMTDLDMWKRVNERAGFLLLVSVTSIDEDLRVVMEPGASSFASRIDMLYKFKSAGCMTGVLAMPFLPGLSDDEKSIRALYSACKDANVDFIMPGGLTLRPGRQKEFYLAALDRYQPELVPITESLYIENRASGAPLAKASRMLRKRIEPIQREFNLPYLLPHRLTAQLLPPHDALRVLFCDMMELYKERGIDIANLATSARAYDAWLVGLRRTYRRKRTYSLDWLEERFTESFRTGEFATIIANTKLQRFVEEIVLSGARLDYLTLKLE
jgi:DNA repair photolyase